MENDLKPLKVRHKVWDWLWMYKRKFGMKNMTEVVRDLIICYEEHHGPLNGIKEE